MTAATPVVLVQVDAYAHMGWVCDADERQRLVEAIERAGHPVEVWSVDTVDVLTARLDGAPVDPRGPALYWPNAYLIDAAAGAPVDLVALLEARGCPIVGSPAAALATMRDKRRTQAALEAAGLPVPARVDLYTAEPLPALRDRLAALTPPLMVKPATTAGSHGIDLDARCLDHDAAARRALAVLERYGDAVVEEFLPGADTTVALLGNGAKRRAFANHYLVADRDPATAPLDRRSRVMKWGGGKTMPPVTDPALLDQLRALAPAAADAIGARDITRVDGRVDRHGRFRIFDVNGMPGLDCPEGVIVRQFVERAPERDPDDVFDRLVADILAAATARMGEAISPTTARSRAPMPEV